MLFVGGRPCIIGDRLLFHNNVVSTCVLACLGLDKIIRVIKLRVAILVFIEFVKQLRGEPLAIIQSRDYFSVVQYEEPGMVERGRGSVPGKEERTTAGAVPPNVSVTLLSLKCKFCNKPE